MSGAVEDYRRYDVDWLQVGVIFLLIAYHSLLSFQSDEFATYASNAHGLVLGFICFIFGYGFVQAGEGFWKNMKWIGPLSLVLALGLYLDRQLGWIGLGSSVTGAESGFWILGVVGLASMALNKPSPAPSYLSKAVYPVYILHLPIENTLNLWIIQLPFPPAVQWFSLFALTMALSFGLYELIKRLPFLQAFFGIFRQKSSPQGTKPPSPSSIDG